MSEPTSAFALKARYLFPVDIPPVTDGVLTIAGDRIVAVGQNASGRPALDLGNVAILPGLINAHTHLEFSDLSTPIGQPGMPFTNWIAAVVAHRRQQDSSSADIAKDRAAAVGQGLTESLGCGSTTLAEIAIPSWPEQVVESSPIRTTAFLELLGLSADSIEPLVGQARDHIAAGSGAKWRAGLSPHAPYTVHPDLLQRAAQVSRKFKVPLAILRSGTGPFVELLETLDAWDPAAIARGTSPLDYLRVLSQSHRVLVVHGNYLNCGEIEFLAARSEHMSVVFCPRTHAYFGHKDYPLAEMLSAGVNVALGTDSRASNPDLSVLEEMRHISRHHDAVSPADILGLGTTRGAKSLGLDSQLGTLTAGKCADLTVVQLPDTDSGDPYGLLFGSSGPVVRTYCRGRPYCVEGSDQSEPAG